MFKLRVLSGLAGFGFLVAVVGCGSSSAPAPTSSGPPVQSTGMPVAGKADGKSAFDSNCAKCHVLNGVGGGKGGWNNGPDLSTVGADHSAEWIAAYAADPKKLNPKSKMPPQDKRMTAEQMKAVGEYLAKMK